MGIMAPMKLAAFALLLFASLLASLTHGMAAAPYCVEAVAEMQQDAGGGADERSALEAEPDDAHCGFGMTAPGCMASAWREAVSKSVNWPGTPLGLWRWQKLSSPPA